MSLRIALAPMEGLADSVMRDALTRVGGMDWCVTEFIRVTGSLLPARTFARISPELLNGARTPAGTIVRVQLLGSDPICLADNAARAAELGAPVVDLNFGCPAKTVNRHRGGAVLLEEPELLFRIVEAVRRAVPAAIPVTAKMRLGVADTSPALDAAAALQDGGASELVVHARTKLDGYRPPAHWEWIARIAQHVRIPVIANGEIWTVEDYLRCREVSGLRDIMLGRGLVARPDLAWRIRQAVEGGDPPEWNWPQLQALLEVFFVRAQDKFEASSAPGRLKQWLGYLRKTYPEADAMFRRIRQERACEAVARALADVEVCA